MAILSFGNVCGNLTACLLFQILPPPIHRHSDEVITGYNGTNSLLFLCVGLVAGIGACLLLYLKKADRYIRKDFENIKGSKIVPKHATITSQHHITISSPINTISIKDLPKRPSIEAATNSPNEEIDDNKTTNCNVTDTSISGATAIDNKDNQLHTISTAPAKLTKDRSISSWQFISRTFQFLFKPKMLALVPLFLFSVSIHNYTSIYTYTLH